MDYVKSISHYFDKKKEDRTNPKEADKDNGQDYTDDETGEHISESYEERSVQADYDFDSDDWVF